MNPIRVTRPWPDVTNELICMKIFFMFMARKASQTLKIVCKALLQGNG